MVDSPMSDSALPEAPPDNVLSRSVRATATMKIVAVLRFRTMCCKGEIIRKMQLRMEMGSMLGGWTAESLERALGI
jgi:hypothetical protein